MSRESYRNEPVDFRGAPKIATARNPKPLSGFGLRIFGFRKVERDIFRLSTFEFRPSALSGSSSLIPPYAFSSFDFRLSQLPIFDVRKLDFGSGHQLWGFGFRGCPLTGPFFVDLSHRKPEAETRKGRSERTYCWEFLHLPSHRPAFVLAR